MESTQSLRGITPTLPVLQFAYRLPQSNRLMRFALVNPRINDIFIAYSPADANFARLLDAALRHEEADPWIDYDDMIAGTDHQAQIQAGIRQADVFVLVASEAAFQSADIVASLELAQRLNKMVIWVSREASPEVSREGQPWLPLPAPGPWHRIQTPAWETAFEELAKTIIHLQIYLRFVARTLEWDRRDRPATLLLTEDDLAAVVERRQWLEAQPFARHLQVTQLQTEFLNQSIRQVKANQQTAYLDRTQPDIFISYSRKDREFVKELAAALTQHRWRIWVDWENIPVATDWREEVHDGIRNAHTFLMVISPDSIASEPCRWELQKARTYQKRIIPLVCRDHYDRELFKATGLAAINYISCTRQPFTAALAVLLKTLETDLEDTKVYNRLLVRAHEWAERGRPEGLLMTPAALRDTLRWCQHRGRPRSQSRGPALPLLPLQEEYIAVSRKHIRARRNTSRLAAFLVMSLVIFLAALATTTTVSEIKALVASLTERQQLDALVIALKAGRRTQESNWLVNWVNPQLRSQATTVLHDAILGLREVNRFTGHLGSVYSLAFSPDGQILASVGKDRQLRLWNIENGRMSDPNFGLGHTDDVVTVAISADGTHIATGSYDGSVKVWRYDAAAKAALFDPGGAAGVYPYRTPQTLPRSHTDWVTKVAFSAQGDFLASASFDGTVQLWQALRSAGGSEVKFGDLRQLDHGQGFVYSLDFSPVANDRLVTADVKGIVRLWNTQGQLLQQVDHGGAVFFVLFNPAGDQVAIAGADGSVRLWDLAKNRSVRLAEVHEGQIFQLAYSPDGSLLASASQDGTVKLWDSRSGAMINTLRGHVGSVYRVAFYSGDLLASAGRDGTVRLWSTSTGNLLDTLSGHQDSVIGIAFSQAPPQPLLASASEDSVIRLWQVESPVKPLPHTNQVNGVRFRPDGQVIATSGQNTIRFWYPDGTNTDIFLKPKDSQNSNFLSLDYDPSGQILATGEAQGQVYLWQAPRIPGPAIARQQAAMPLEAAATVPYLSWQAHPPGSPDSATRGVALRFSPRFPWLVTGGSDGKLKFWPADMLARADAPSARDRTPVKPVPLHTLEHRSSITDISFSADGEFMAASSLGRPLQGDSGSILIWHLQADARGRPLTTLVLVLDRTQMGHQGDVLSLAFNPLDSTELASGGADGTIKIWRLERRLKALPRYLVKTLPRYGGAITDLSYSADGQFLVSSNRDGSIHLWETQGELISILKRHTAEVTSVQFNPQVRDELASGSLDNRALLWHLWPTGKRSQAVTDLQQGDILKALMTMGCDAGQPYLESRLHLQQQATNISEPEAEQLQEIAEVEQYCRRY